MNVGLTISLPHTKNIIQRDDTKDTIKMIVLGVIALHVGACYSDIMFTMRDNVYNVYVFFLKKD